MKKFILGILFLIGVLFLPLCAWAIPNLQIYIPGATYDMETETWIINSYEYDLMVVGANLEIEDVKFAIAVPEGEDGSISVTWTDSSHDDLVLNETDAMNYGDYWDYYSAKDHTSANHDYSTYAFGVAEDGDYPLMGDGAALPGHGVFPTDFYEYYIGDFDTGDIVYNFNPPDGYDGDSYFIDYYGTETDEVTDDLSSLDTGWGEMKTFHIVVEDYTWADIVAYDHVIVGKNKAKYVFSPFSHDGGGNPVPEPATMLLLGSGIAGLFGLRGRLKRS